MDDLQKQIREEMKQHNEQLKKIHPDGPFRHLRRKEKKGAIFVLLWVSFLIGLVLGVYLVRWGVA